VFLHTKQLITGGMFIELGIHSKALSMVDNEEAMAPAKEAKQDYTFSNEKPAFQSLLSRPFPPTSSSSRNYSKHSDPKRT